MFSLKFLAVTAFSAATLLGAANAYGQSDTTPPAPSSEVQSKKAIREQNRQLERKVRHALTTTKHLDASEILVVARGGKVTLEGSADDTDQIQKAASVAASVPGVTSVTNNLRVYEPGGD